MPTTWSVIKKAFYTHLPAIIIFLLAVFLFIPYPFMSDYAISDTSDMLSFNQMYYPMAEFVKNNNLSSNPLWLPNMFAGMPTIVMFGWIKVHLAVSNIYMYFLNLFLVRHEILYFFLSCLYMYIFCRVIKIDIKYAVIAGLVYTFASYNPEIVSAAHTTKLITIANLPIIMAATVLTFEGLLLEGFLVLCMTIGLSFAHQQITYYTLIVGVFLFAYYVYSFIKQRKQKQLLKAVLVLILGIVIGTGEKLPSSLMLLDYNKQSLRGGRLHMDEEPKTTPDDNNAQHTSSTKAPANNSGLDIDYAFSWSYGKLETLTFLFPGLYGYGFSGLEADKNSATTQLFQKRFGYSENDAIKAAHPLLRQSYWGNQPFVEGPIYFGVLVCFLVLICLVLGFKSNKHLPWLVGVTVLAIAMSWGRHFMWFNELLFEYLPLYNKYRTPSMILIIPQFTFAVMSVTGLKFLVDHIQQFTLKSQYGKKLLAVAASLLLVGLLLYATLDFHNMPPRTQNRINQFAQQGGSVGAEKILEDVQQSDYSNDVKFFVDLLQRTQGNISATNQLFKALIKDRKAGFFDNIVFAFWMLVVFIGLLFLLANGKIKPLVFVAIVGLLIYGDLFYMGKNYVFKEKYTLKKETKINLKKTPTDELILQDKDPNYRVYNVSSRDAFQENATSAFHKSIGGYSPAKLSIYDDLIQYQLRKNNMEVLNMLNTRYIIRQDRVARKPIVQKNPNANGNCWFVEQVRLVPSPQAEMRALDNFDSKKVAFVQEKYSSLIPVISPQIDKTAYIKQSYFSFDTIRYTYECSTPQVAIFSEVYSPYWRAFDSEGNEMDVFKADYVLRGLSLPAGKDVIEFRCRPRKYAFYAAWGYGSSYLRLAAVFIGLLLFTWQYYKRHHST